jgi:hypothetical protein
VVFAGDFENGRERVGKGVYAMADALCDLLRVSVRQNMPI